MHYGCSFVLKKQLNGMIFPFSLHALTRWDVFELQMACESEAASLMSQRQHADDEDGYSGVIATALSNMVKAIEEVGSSSG